MISSLVTSDSAQSDKNKGFFSVEILLRQEVGSILLQSIALVSEYSL